MNGLLQNIIASQYEAGLCTLAHCVVRCPEGLWNTPIARYPFCQTAFHTLFFTDVYLEPSPESFKLQPFHLANTALFADYEQMEDREPTSLYDRSQIRMYLEFCRSKAVSTLTRETDADLAAPTQFPRKSFSRAELHLYNIRHLQHHAAQLILRLRLDTDIDIPWIGTGWREP